MTTLNYREFWQQYFANIEPQQPWLRGLPADYPVAALAALMQWDEEEQEEPVAKGADAADITCE